MLKLHNLHVYEKALALAAQAQPFSASWGRRHAIVEHDRRASESMVLNIAESARLWSGPNKAKSLDYAIGSSLECAACLDIALIKGRLTQELSLSGKRNVLEITRRLVGLRKSWLASVLREEAGSHDAESSADGVEQLFHHESLDVYKISLDFMRWFTGLPGGRELSDRWCREIDKSATGMVLNVAEGNGRYSAVDHQRFLDIAAASTVKTAAYLDLYAQKALPAHLATTAGRELLCRILAMLHSF
jgi:four helix bundle protein